MRNLVFLALLIVFNANCFMEKFYARMLLGADTLAEVERVCRGKKYQHEYDAEYDALYTKLVNTPPPLLIRLLDTFSWQSRESRLATLWFETGEAITLVLYTLIVTSPLGMAVWYDELAQNTLRERYAKQDVDEFNRLMRNLEVTYKEMAKKIKLSGSFRPLYYPAEFKHADIELEVHLRQARNTLSDLMTFIDRVSPHLNNSPFKMLALVVTQVEAELEASYQKLPFVNDSAVKTWYNNMRSKALESAINRCLPPLRPLAARS